MKKGGEVIPHPFDLEFFSNSFIISIPTSQPDKTSDFIFPAYSSTYGENRQNRGLTRFPEIFAALAGDRFPISWGSWVARQTSHGPWLPTGVEFESQTPRCHPRQRIP